MLNAILISVVDSILYRIYFFDLFVDNLKDYDTLYMYTNRVKQTHNAGTNCNRFPLVCHLDVSRQCVLTSKFIPIYLLIFLSVGVSSYGTLSKGVFWYSFLLVCYPLIFLYVGLLSFHIFSGWCTTFFDSPFYMSVCYFLIFLPDRWFLNLKTKLIENIIYR